MAETTVNDLERLWNDNTNETFTQEHKKNFHEYKAGSISVFDCDEKCTLVSFVKDKKVLLTKKGPGHMEDIPTDIDIFARDGSTKGS
ncbi:hypothetical protein BKA56DRAFT_574592 [Ilyonectria sp. MPI-CAGE-AT-0026]|nr:hypothetical protein BKA56DRAFT_574592 [Ilyonectria sp. MPI-CAGE-AT-0026]